MVQMLRLGISSSEKTPRPMMRSSWLYVYHLRPRVPPLRPDSVGRSFLIIDGCTSWTMTKITSVRGLNGYSGGMKSGIFVA